MKRIDVFKSKYGGTRLYYYKMKGNIYEMRIAVEIWATDFAIMCMAVAVSFSFHMFWYIRSDDGCFVQPKLVAVLDLL